MSQPACCTCATLLSAALRGCPSSEKPLPDDRALECCGRTICGACIHRNPRFLSYCPYCQTSGRIRSPVTSRSRQRPSSTEDSNPPPYAAVANNGTDPTGPPPPYSASPAHPAPSTPLLSIPYSMSEEKTYLNKDLPPQPEDQGEDQSHYTVHHLRHPPHPNPDTLASLSLQYGIPLPVLRHHNNLPRNADFLFFARRTLLIPTAHITNLSRLPHSSSSADDDDHFPQQSPSLSLSLSLSLSPHPVEDEASRARKTAIRRWMVACKEADYDAALVYLEASGYDLQEAVRRYLDDAAWERAHPNQLQGGRKGKSSSRKGKGTVPAGTAGEGGGLFGWLRG